jgi:transmembrane sensor
LGAGYLFRNQLSPGLFPSAKTAAIQADTAQVSGVKLVLGDGKSVVFSRDKPQKFSIAGIELNNTGDQLQYQGSAGAFSALNTLIVPEKEDYEITLSDGTRVSLNAQSSLKFPFHFTGGVREVYLQGEAYLEVTKDSKHPFIVHTPLADIHVTGTSFNVNTYEEGIIRTALIEGKVVMQATDKKPLELVPGLEGQYTEQAGFTTARFDPGEVLSWRQGVYYFHNQRLDDLKGLISRWFGAEVVFENKSLAQHTVSGVIEKEHLTEFLDDLTTTSGITYVHKGTVLYLK